MDLDFFSQYAPKNSRQVTSRPFCSQPVLQDTMNLESIIPLANNELQQPGFVSPQERYQLNDSTSISSENGHMVTKLFNDYKCMSDELTNSLIKYRTEKITMENEINRLLQENDYLMLEIDRQKASIEDLKECGTHLSKILSKEEFETKKIVELKLLEFHEILYSIETTDKCIEDFKMFFSKSISEAQKYCNGIKQDLIIFKEDSLKSSNEYLSLFDKFTDEYKKELVIIKEKILEAESKIENGIVKVKENSFEKIQYETELKKLLHEIEEEQNKKKDLQNGLLHYSNLIVKMDEDFSLRMSNNEKEMTQLQEELAQLSLKKTSIMDEISSSENDLIYLKERDAQTLSDINSLQAVLVKKRHDDEIIQQEIGRLEKLAESLRKDCTESTIEINNKKHIETELQELELEVANMLRKCEELDEKRIEISKSDPKDLLIGEEVKLEKIKSIHHELNINVTNAKKIILEKQSAVATLQVEGNNLRDLLQQKHSDLKNYSEETDDIKNLKMENEGLSIKVEELEKKIEEEKKIIAYLEKLKSRQIEIFEKYADEFGNKLTEKNDAQWDELFETYKETLESLKELDVVDLDERIKRVNGAVEYNQAQTDEAIEINKNLTEQLQVKHNENIEILYHDVEEHGKYCEDMGAKLDSEMHYIKGKISNLMDDIKGKSFELASNVPKLAASVKTALDLFEKIVEYYCRACEERQSSVTISMHWDNTREVLQEILLHPLHKLSKLKGMPFINTLSSSPQAYQTVISRANSMFNNIASEKKTKPIQYTCKRLMEMRDALYHLSDNLESGLNDTIYSSTTDWV